MPSSAEALFIAMLAVVPGFVATVVWARANTWKGAPGDLRLVLQSLALSLIIQAVAAPVTIVWLYPHRSALAEFPGGADSPPFGPLPRRRRCGIGSSPSACPTASSSSSSSGTARAWRECSMPIRSLSPRLSPMGCS